VTYVKAFFRETRFLGLGLAIGAAIGILFIEQGLRRGSNRTVIALVGVLVLGVVWAWIGFIARKSSESRTKGRKDEP